MEQEIVPQQEVKIRSLRKKVEAHSEILEKIVNQIIVKYNRELDQFIQQVRNGLKRGRMGDDELEDAVLKIPVFMYSAISGLESLGIEGEAAKAQKMEIFNQAYAEIEGTIQDKTKYAELEAFSEHLLEVAYSRAYRKLKAQIDAAEHVFSGAKKVLSKRMMEYEVNSRDNGIQQRRRNRFDD